MTRWRWVLVVAIAVAVVLSSTTVLGTARWAQETDRIERALVGASRSSTQGRVEEASLVGLPEPVRRYLAAAIRDGQPPPAIARFRQTGRLRTGVESQQWLPFEARETVVPSAMGFVWDAKIRVAPLLHVAMRDAYVGGTGIGRVGLQSALVVSEEEGGSQLNTGELYRLLAEAPWCPTLLLSGRGVTWAAVDAHRARATLTQAQTTAVVEFRFNDADEIVSVFAAERPRQYGTTYIATPWEGRFGEYATVRGLRIPTTGEVGWWIDDRFVPVWQGTFSDFDYR